MKKKHKPPLPPIPEQSPEQKAAALLQAAEQRNIDEGVKEIDRILATRRLKLQAVVTIIDLSIHTQVRVITNQESSSNATR